MESAFLMDANLEGVTFIVAHLEGAKLMGANLKGSNFMGAHLEKADLRRANLEGADLGGAFLEGTNFSSANLDRTNVAGVAYNRLGKFRGIRVTTCYGSPMFKRFAQDQDFIEELEERGKYKEKSWPKRLYWKALYYSWKIFADFGRTPWQWILWSIFFALYFGLNYFFMGRESFKVAVENSLPWLLNSIYYSVVTFTTLGFGDITPITKTAAGFVMAEVILGYVMLGGLISIFATLLARRSGQ
jgi:hypothetical protein